MSDASALAPRVPSWYRWYFALALLNLVTMCLCLWLGFKQATMFSSGISTHEVYAQFLEHIGEVRTLAAEMNAPGNDVFLSRDPVAESVRLEAVASRFRQRYTDLKSAVSGKLEQRAALQIETYFPQIDKAASLTLLEARQIFSFMAAGKQELASEHMATMDKHNSQLGEAILSMEQVIRRDQEGVLAKQHSDATVVRMYGLALAVLVALIAIAAVLHGQRVQHAIREDNLLRESHLESLRAARNQAEHAARIKTQFLANMSHEIRTPMNGVLGMLDALATTKLSTDQASIVKTANASADLLLAIIDDILDFSKIEAGMLVIETLPVDIAAIVHYIVSVYNVQAQEKLIELRFELADDVPPRVLADPTRLTQLLANFTSNAIKFTERGAVTIGVTVLRQDAATARLRFAVKDSGIGISKEAQARLFTAFTQADGSTSRRFGGTGLGLAICRKLVHLLDPKQGEIGVVSHEGEGAEFFFVLELARTTGVAEPIVATRTTQQTAVQQHFTARVLVAEDNDTNQQVAITMLRGMGIEAVIAEDGRQALQAVQRQPFDLILMDYHMPNLDGSEATQAIREYERDHALPHTPIIALTASVLNEDRERCRKAGMDDFLAKPMRNQQLREMLSKWLPSEAIHQVRHSRDDGNSSFPNVHEVVSHGTTDDAFPLQIESTAMTTHSDYPDELFDAAQLLEMKEITGAGFAGLLQQLTGNIHTGVASMRAACAANDAEELRRAAHKLKGSSATLGVKQVADQCLQLEMLGKVGSVVGALELIEELVRAYLRAKPYLDECVADGACDGAAQDKAIGM